VDPLSGQKKRKKGKKKIIFLEGGKNKVTSSQVEGGELNQEEEKGDK